MRFRTTAILAAIFVLLAGFLVIMKWQGTGQKVERIFAFNPQEVEEIRLTKDKQTVILRKEEKEWKVSMSTQTGSARPIADERIVHSLLSVFDYGILEVIQDHPSNLSDFGLDHPEFEVGIKVKGGSLKTLLIGSDNPTQTSCYAKVETSPRVLLLGILYKTDLNSIFDRLYSHADGQSKRGSP